MQKDNNEEQNAQDKKLLSFVPNLLANINSFDANRLNEITHFFSKAYRELSQHELFDDQDYRLEWTENIYVLELIASSFKGYSNHEMETAIQTTLITLSQRKEVSNG